jgi:ABC-type branched-subunit amino acid transport system substrate-binding protein
MLLPRSAGGNGQATATAFRNAAELALRDFPGAGIQVAIYDTTGTPAGADAAMGAALSDGAEIVLGPVFAAQVAAAAPKARAAGKPVVAFSSDAGVAGPGVYLMTFLPADDVERIVSYAAAQGRRSFAAVLPQNAYGVVAEAAFRRSVADAGARIVAIETYQTPEEVRAKTARIASLASQIDALFIPDTAEVVPAIAAVLGAAGVTRDRVKLLGSGQWDDSRALNSPALVGSWYPAPVAQGFLAFSRRYSAAYGAPPPRNASLAYDATILAAGLVRQGSQNRFAQAELTNPNGFVGLDGVFRFLPNGQIQRRLAVYEVTGSGARIVSAAAQSFADDS